MEINIKCKTITLVEVTVEESVGDLASGDDLSDAALENCPWVNKQINWASVKSSAALQKTLLRERNQKLHSRQNLFNTHNQ